MRHCLREPLSIMLNNVMSQVLHNAKYMKNPKSKSKVFLHKLRQHGFDQIQSFGMESIRSGFIQTKPIHPSNYKHQCKTSNAVYFELLGP